MKVQPEVHTGTLAEKPIPAGHIAYRPDVDGLRAIAVLSVLAFHAFPNGLRGGFTGVDIFFVISGYLISKVILTTIANGTFSIADFYSRRIRRIFPALILVLLACLVFGWQFMLADNLSALAKHAFGGAGFVSNFVLWHEAGYFDAASNSKLLLHLWSLGIEEQFYLIWPLLLWAAWRVRLPLMPVIVVTGIASFIVNLATVHHDATAAFYSPASRAWELMVGGALAHWTSPQGAHERSVLARVMASIGLRRELTREAWFGESLAIVGLMAIAYGLLRIDDHRPFPGSWALLPTLGSACLIAAGPRTWLARHVLASRPMVAVGLISYPLYLWHWPLLVAARTVHPEGPSAAVIASMLLIAAVLAWATYRFIERPMRSGSRNPAKVALLACCMLAVAGISATIWAKNGVASRYPEIVQRATEYDLNGWRAAMRHKRCFMELGQDASQFAPECVDAGNQPLWVLWGDSGAAAMYAGLRSIANEAGTIRLAQFTSSQCPPMMGFDSSGNRACTANNKWILEKIASLRPAVVILSAMWGQYDKSSLPATIAALKARGVGRIIVLGPVPTWSDTPSRITFNLWREDPLHRVPPAHLNYAKYGLGQADYRPGTFDQRTQTADAVLAKVAHDTGADFVAITPHMCDASGCLMRESDSSGTPFYLDIMHLTPAGSVFVAHTFRAEIGLPGKAGQR
ncbi:acyltransferase family protein [Dyella acidiphila]|uniref:Acyltransferase n=1 Tax=Dyella acidiphila TaxID=2775866 RepID=A0ABR9G4V2_9GAMM|nr:acyltransferase family protein [Dyella acidiphila]MBE1159043.1 acyltransferase [Dyella acidiphila]